MPARKQNTGRSRKKNTSRVNENRNREREDQDYQRRGSTYDNYRFDRDDIDTVESDDLYEDSDTRTARAEYSGRNYNRRNVGRSRSHREGNIIQRAADRIREVWEDLMHEGRSREESSYRNRRKVYSTDEGDYDAGEWRRENYLDRSSGDTEHHFRDNVHRQPFYDDGRIHSHYNNDLERSLGNTGSRRRSRNTANEYTGRDKRRGSRYSSSDNYHARTDDYQHEDYGRNNDRG